MSFGTDRKPAKSMHPGTFVLEEMDAEGWSRGKLAVLLRWMPWKLNGMLSERLRVTHATAKDLARVFKNSPEYWLNLQELFDKDAGVAQ